MWFLVRVISVCENHSGYAFKGTVFDTMGLVNATDAASHDFHHTYNCGNFGKPLYDWIFGTMDGYLALGGEKAYLARASEARAALACRDSPLPPTDRAGPARPGEATPAA